MKSYLCLAILCWCNIFYAGKSFSQSNIDSLLSLLQKEQTDTGKSRLYLEIGNLHSQMGDSMDAHYAVKGLELARKEKWDAGYGRACILLSRIYRERSEYPRALEYGREAFEAYKKINDKDGMARALQSDAQVYTYAGLFTKALEISYASVALFEEVNDKAGLAGAYITMGACYRSLDDNKQALQFYEKALALNKEIGNKINIGKSIGNLGVVYETTGQYDKAAVNYKMAKKIFEEIGDEYALALLYSNEGDLFSKMGNYTASYNSLMLALEKEQKLGREIFIGTIHHTLGELFLLAARTPGIRSRMPLPFHKGTEALRNEALGHFKIQLEIGKQISDLTLLRNGNEMLSIASEELGNYKEALAYYKEGSRYKDSILNDENKQKIVGMEIGHLTETKDREISLLNKDKELQAAALERKNLLLYFILAGIAIISIFSYTLVRSYHKKKEAQYSQQISEVEMQVLRLQMNPHFIFNSLNAINKYILNNDRQEASSYLAKFSGLMRLTLENSRLPEVILAQDLHALELYMQLESLRFSHGFRYRIDVAPEIDKENTLIPPMLLQPFVENAILHGIRDKTDGEIDVRIVIEGASLRCIVQDNGDGLAAKSAHETPGEKNKHVSMSVKITQERLRIIERLKKVPTSFAIISGDGEKKKERPGVKVELVIPYELAF